MRSDGEITSVRRMPNFSFTTTRFQNTLALANDPPGRGADDPNDYRYLIWRDGSQWEYTPVGDPTILAMSINPGYVYALGDATNLYNSTYEGPTDILHASRSIVWLAPDVIVVKQGRPVRLDFYRDETASCSEQVVFGDFGIARDLPAFKTTTIELTPEKAGEFTFTCGMNMIRGKLVVEPA